MLQALYGTGEIDTFIDFVTTTGAAFSTAMITELFGINFVGTWTDAQKGFVAVAALITGSKLSDGTDKTASQAFKAAYGVTQETPFEFTLGSCKRCNGKGAYTYGSRDIQYYSGLPFYSVTENRNESQTWITNVYSVIHEFGHAFANRFKSGGTLSGIEYG